MSYGMSQQALPSEVNDGYDLESFHQALAREAADALSGNYPNLFLPFQKAEESYQPSPYGLPGLPVQSAVGFSDGYEVYSTPAPWGQKYNFTYDHLNQLAGNIEFDAHSLHEYLYNHPLGKGLIIWIQRQPVGAPNLYKPSYAGSCRYKHCKFHGARNKLIQVGHYRVAFDELTARFPNGHKADTYIHAAFLHVHCFEEMVDIAHVVRNFDIRRESRTYVNPRVRDDPLMKKKIKNKMLLEDRRLAPACVEWINNIRGNPAWEVKSKENSLTYLLFTKKWGLRPHRTKCTDVPGMEGVHVAHFGIPRPTNNGAWGGVRVKGYTVKAMEEQLGISARPHIKQQSLDEDLDDPETEKSTPRPPQTPPTPAAPGPLSYAPSVRALAPRPLPRPPSPRPLRLLAPRIGGPSVESAPAADSEAANLAPHANPTQMLPPANPAPMLPLSNLASAHILPHVSSSLSYPVHSNYTRGMAPPVTQCMQDNITSQWEPQSYQAPLAQSSIYYYHPSALDIDPRLISQGGPPVISKPQQLNTPAGTYLPPGQRAPGQLPAPSDMIIAEFEAVNNPKFLCTEPPSPAVPFQEQTAEDVELFSDIDSILNTTFTWQ